MTNHPETPAATSRRTIGAMYTEADVCSLAKELGVEKSAGSLETTTPGTLVPGRWSASSGTSSA
jgi:hypothetical protein